MPDVQVNCEFPAVLYHNGLLGRISLVIFLNSYFSIFFHVHKRRRENNSETLLLPALLKSRIILADEPEKLMAKTGWRTLLFLVGMIVSSVAVHAQNESDESSMQTLLKSKRYTFTAQFAQPLSGRQVNLTTLYTVTLTPDSLLCDLPYYGVAYTAPIDPTKNGLHFTSLHFDYEVMPAKHGRYIVSIRINDRTTVQQMYLSVSKKGYASLRVTPQSKQAISYYGSVTATKVKER